MKIFLMTALLALQLVQPNSYAFGANPKPSPSPSLIPGNRIASVYIAQDFVNEQLAAHSKSQQLVQSMNITLDPDSGDVILRGVVQVPTEELRAVNLDPKLGVFKFQVAIKLTTTTKGHLIIEFPLDETYFYPADSKDPKHDRVIVPVQMMSLALASARGYIAALSGDFGGFDRRTAKLEALIKTLDESIKREKNSDAKEELTTERDGLKVQLEAVPIERKQLQAVAKEVSSVLGFTGEKEISLNDELAAKKNAIILKIKLSQLVPYLQGVELGGIRILHDKKDGDGMNYLAIDVNADLETALPPITRKPTNGPGAKIAPSLIMRLNQALFESKAVIDAEKQKMGSNLTDFDLELKEDGLHVSGKYHTFLLTLPFDTVVNFVTTKPDVFEVRVEEIKVAGINFGFLEKFILASMEHRLDQSLKGMCTFKYVGEEKDGARALEVTVDPKALVPAFPDLHLIEVDVREREFLLKIGRI